MIKKRSYKNFEEGKFLEKIKNTSWWDVYLITDVNEAVQLFTTKVTTILDQMAPVKTFQTIGAPLGLLPNCTHYYCIVA